MEASPQRDHRPRAACGRTDVVEAALERVASTLGELHRVALARIDDRAQESVGNSDQSTRAKIGHGTVEHGLGGGRVTEVEDEHCCVLPYSEGAQSRLEFALVERSGDGLLDDVAGEPSLGVAHHAAPHQLERDDGDRLLQDQAL
jgi:hypothetical protein